MKIYTDLEQSKKLAEILPLESADAIYYYQPKFECSGGWYKFSYGTNKIIMPLDIPCWSLTALLDVLPKGTDIIKEEADTENEKYMCTVGIKDDIIPTFGNNPVDACYEMTLELHKQKLL